MYYPINLEDKENKTGANKKSILPLYWEVKNKSLDPLQCIVGKKLNYCKKKKKWSTELGADPLT